MILKTKEKNRIHICLLLVVICFFLAVPNSNPDSSVRLGSSDRAFSLCENSFSQLFQTPFVAEKNIGIFERSAISTRYEKDSNERLSISLLLLTILLTGIISGFSQFLQYTLYSETIKRFSIIHFLHRSDGKKTHLSFIA